MLGDESLDFVVLLSSSNSLLGAPGLADYSSANAALDAFVDCAGRPAGWRHVAAINYAPWSDVGMSARSLEGGGGGRQRRTEDAPQLSIPPAAGAEAFARVLASGRAQVAVDPQDLPYLMELVRAHAAGVTTATAPDVAPESKATPAATASEQNGRMVATPYEPPASDTERRLAAIWSELLGVDRIGVHDDFFELGGHSLLATRVLSRIEQAIGARLTLRDVFDAPTVHRLAERIGVSPRTASPSSDGADDEREEMDF